MVTQDKKLRDEMSKVLSVPKIIEIFEKLKKIPISELSGKDKRDARTIFMDPRYKEIQARLVGVIDYRAYYSLPEDLRRQLYFIFMDVKNATIKAKIAEYLTEKRITSFNLASDMDFVAILLSTDSGKNQFMDNIKKFAADIEFHTYRATQPICLEKKAVRCDGPDISQMGISAHDISRVQANCGDESLEDLPKILEEERVLLGQSVSYDFDKLGLLRDFALFFSIHKDSASRFLELKGIAPHLIDLYTIEYQSPPGTGAGTPKDYTTFYRTAEYLGVLEFPNGEKRATWEMMVGANLLNSNIFFFPISKILHPGPYGTTDIVFDERCSQYSKKTLLPLGNPRNGEPLPSQVGINLRSTNRNGFILGQPHFGKSTTALRLMESLVSNEIVVHLINPTKDLVNMAKKSLGSKVTENRITNLQKSTSGFSGFGDGLHIYPSEQNKNRKRVAYAVLEAIEKTPEVDTKTDKDTGEVYRPLKSVILIDEAHQLLTGPSSKVLVQKFGKSLQTLSHHGLGMFLITQHITELGRRSDSLIPHLENKIFHKISDREAKHAKGLLLQSGIREDSIYDVTEEITKLEPGNVLVSFIDSEGKALPPMKVKIFEKTQ